MQYLSRIRPIIFVVLLALAFIASSFVMFNLDLPKAQPASVEIGLAELSPKGEAGGYAVPASGGSSSCGGSLSCSDSSSSGPAPATITLQVSPSTINQGQTSSLSWAWNMGSASSLTNVVVQRCASTDVISVPITARDAWGNAYTNGYASDCKAWSDVANIPGSNFITTEQRTRTRTCDAWGNCTGGDTYTYTPPTGTSPLYDAKSQNIPGGNYIYRAVGYFSTGPTLGVTSQTVISGALPDLVGVIGDSGTLVAGRAYPINYGVRNLGSTSTVTNTNLELQFDYKRDGWDGNGTDGDFAIGASAGALAGGATQNFTSNGTFSSVGNWRVRTVADISNAVTESNETNNASAWDDFIVVASGPSISLEARSVTGGVDWTTSNFQVVTGNQVELRWSSDDVESCSGSNFSTGGAVNNSGMTPATQPTAGQPVTYTLTCEDEEGNDTTDQITVTAGDMAPVLTASKTTVRTNEPFTLTWNLNGNDPAQCVITGPGSSFASQGSMSTATGNTTINAIGTATYTLDCPGGDDTVDINVLPQIFES